MPLKRTNDGFIGFLAKRTRYDENGQQVVPQLMGGSAAGGGAGDTGSNSSDHSNGPASSRSQSPLLDVPYEVPKPGTPVDRKVVKRVGDKYLLGPQIGNGPVECINQYLARLENTDQFFHLKILVLDADPQSKKAVEGEKQAKLLLHSEYQLLKMLENEEGVIRAYDLFMDSAFEEEPALEEGGSKYVYTGRVKRRIVLAVDCLAPHDFDDRSNAFINLQQYVIREKNLSEMKTLLVFYEIIKIVENLHKKNIVHRDLKLRNIILNTTTNRVVVTNFCLGKQLLNEDDYLHDQRGSPAYISPDVLSASHQKPYKGKPSDIWALGVVLYTMLYSQFPFFETKPAALFKRIKSVDYKIPKHTKVSEGTQYLIKNMLLLNPDHRLTATEIRKAIERMISNRRQFFLRIDQMVPEIDVQSRTKGGGTNSTSTTSAVTPANVMPNEPQFELSRQRFGPEETAVEGDGDGNAGDEVAVGRRGGFPDGVVYFPKRDRPRMSVQHLANDARLLTGDEWGQFSRIIREHGGSGQPPTMNNQVAGATVGSGNNSSSSAPGNNSSTMTARLAAARSNAMRARAMFGPGRSMRTTSSSEGQAQLSGGGGVATAQPPPPPPLRTSDPAIAQAVALARAASRGSTNSPAAAGGTNAPVDLQLNDFRIFGSLFPRNSGHRSSSSGSLSAGNGSNGGARRTAGNVSPVFTIRLRPGQQGGGNGLGPAAAAGSLAESSNQFLLRVDRFLSNRQDEAAREFCNQLTEMFSRGRIPSRPEGEQCEFDGVLTTELAEQIGEWLLQDCGELAIVRDIFAESTVNAKEKVVELLRRCGVQVDIGPTIEIKRVQSSYDSLLVCSYILQATGYSSLYFTT